MLRPQTEARNSAGMPKRSAIYASLDILIQANGGVDQSPGCQVRVGLSTDTTPQSNICAQSYRSRIQYRQHNLASIEGPAKEFFKCPKNVASCSCMFPGPSPKRNPHKTATWTAQHQRAKFKHDTSKAPGSLAEPGIEWLELIVCSERLG